MTDRNFAGLRPRRRASLAVCAFGAGLLAVVAGCPSSNTNSAPAGPGTTKTVPGATANGGYGEQKPADPATEREPIFVDWAKPKLTLVFTGDQHGYFEPCGCAGPGFQKGGMSRRHTFLKQLAADGWNPVAIDSGGLSRRYGQQAEIKLQTSIDALKAMNYQAIGLAGDDLRFPADFLLSATAGDETFVSANVVVLGNESRFRVIEAGGMKIGVTSVLAGKPMEELQATIDPGITIEDPVEALKNVVAQMKEAGVDQMVLLAYAEPDAARALAKQFPEFQYVAPSRGADEPPREPLDIPDSKAKLIQVGQKGMFAIVVGLYDDAPPRFEKVPLDARFEDSPEMKQLMVGYQDQLKSLGWEGLGVTASLHPRAKSSDDTNAKFVGAEACGKCHTQAYATWKGSKHSHATETLIKAIPPRQFDPECIACHATGWDAEHYAPFIGGFTSMEATPQLAGNGCENCHGPGGGHVAAEEARDPKQRAEMRTLMKLNLAVAEQQTCRQCHDRDNSPLFDFKTYWEKVKHTGKK
jgi:hypothetical protein